MSHMHEPKCICLNVLRFWCGLERRGLPLSTSVDAGPSELLDVWSPHL